MTVHVGTRQHIASDVHLHQGIDEFLLIRKRQIQTCGHDQKAHMTLVILQIQQIDRTGIVSECYVFHK